MTGLVITLIVLLVGGLIVAGIILEQKRIEALRQAATALGLQLTVGKDRALGREFGFLNRLNQGHDRYASNRLTGSIEDEAVFGFDYHYATSSTDSKGRRTTSHHHLHVFTLTLKREVPETLISPESIFSKIAQAFGYDDIDFESAEFSKKFCVRSEDKRFAYDFCDARMIEFLLTRPYLALEAEGKILASIYNGKLTASRLESEVRDLLEIRRRIPTHLEI